MPGIWAINEEQAHTWPTEGGSQAFRAHLDSDNQLVNQQYQELGAGHSTCRKTICFVIMGCPAAAIKEILLCMKSPNYIWKKPCFNSSVTPNTLF